MAAACQFDGRQSMIEPTPLAGVKKEDGREERASRPGYDADWPYCANGSMPAV